MWYVQLQIGELIKVGVHSYITHYLWPKLRVETYTMSCCSWIFVHCCKKKERKIVAFIRVQNVMYINHLLQLPVRIRNLGKRQKAKANKNIQITFRRYLSISGQSFFCPGTDLPTWKNFWAENFICVRTHKIFVFFFRPIYFFETIHIP